MSYWVNTKQSVTSVRLLICKFHCVIQSLFVCKSTLVARVWRSHLHTLPFLSVILIVMFLCGLVSLDNVGCLPKRIVPYIPSSHIASGQKKEKRMYDIQKPKTTTIDIHSWVRWYSKEIVTCRLLLSPLSYFFDIIDFIWNSQQNMWWHEMQMQVLTCMSVIRLVFIFSYYCMQ